jgi:predicted DNA-binding transcriptional regulator AlpA
MDASEEPLDRLVYKPELLRIVGSSYPPIWRAMRENRFPRSVVVGVGKAARVAWRESEIRQWLASRPRQRLLGDPEPEPTVTPATRIRRRLRQRSDADVKE